MQPYWSLAFKDDIEEFTAFPPPQVKLAVVAAGGFRGSRNFVVGYGVGETSQLPLFGFFMVRVYDFRNAH